MKEIHIAFAAVAIGLFAAAALWGAWCWWRERVSAWFWRLLRAAQLGLLLEMAIGGILLALGHHAPQLHLIYGALPVLVSLIAEQLRISSAQMILDARGLESARAVGELPEGDQRAIVVAIVKREIGVMALAAAVIVVLLARAAGTG
jgi:hypothetical protein